MITISPIKKRVRKTSFGELLDYEATAGIQISGENVLRLWNVGKKRSFRKGT